MARESFGYGQLQGGGEAANHLRQAPGLPIGTQVRASRTPTAVCSTHSASPGHLLGDRQTAADHATADALTVSADGLAIRSGARAGRSVTVTTVIN